MNKNNKTIFLGGLSIVIFSSMCFLFDRDVGLEKPKMNNELKPLLVTNEHVFERAVSFGQQAINNFSKPIPKSLRGIDLHIELPLNSDGNLIVGMELKDFFELYLSAMGEEELDDILLRIHSALAQQLTAPALEQGYDALKRFIGYKIELANLETQPIDNNLSELENIRQQKEILAAIQQEYFSPVESEALFAAETQYDSFMLEHLTIQRNENLTVEEKLQQVEALEALLPEDVRVGRASAMAPAKVYQQAQMMRSEGQSDSAVYQMRAEALGEEAASALARLDQQRNQWQQRLDMFSSAYEFILASGLSAEDQQTEVNGLLTREFNSTESIRVRALTGLFEK